MKQNSISVILRSFEVNLSHFRSTSGSFPGIFKSFPVNHWSFKLENGWFKLFPVHFRSTSGPSSTGWLTLSGPDYLSTYSELKVWSISFQSLQINFRLSNLSLFPTKFTLKICWFSQFQKKFFSAEMKKILYFCIPTEVFEC